MGMQDKEVKKDSRANRRADAWLYCWRESWTQRSAKKVEEDIQISV